MHALHYIYIVLSLCIRLREWWWRWCRKKWTDYNNHFSTRHTYYYYFFPLFGKAKIRMIIREREKKVMKASKLEKSSFAFFLGLFYSLSLSLMSCTHQIRSSKDDRPTTVWRSSCSIASFLPSSSSLASYLLGKKKKKQLSPWQSRNYSYFPSFDAFQN